MYLISIKDLKAEVKTEIEKSINSKLKCDILGIQVQATDFNGVVSVTVVFKNNHGTAVGLLKRVEDGNYQLLAPMKVNFTKKEDSEDESKKLS